MERSLGWQVAEIARHQGVSRAALYKRGLEGKFVPLDGPRKRFIECSLLGDGSIAKASTGHRFTMSGSNEIYIGWVKDSLLRLGFPLVDSGMFLLRKEKSGFKKDCRIFYATTRVGWCYQELRDSWYPTSGKEVPKEFVWGMDALQRLYVEDGCLESGKKVIYWGSKSKDSLQGMLDFIDSKGKVLSVKGSTSGGARVRFEADMQPLPGYEYKF